MPKGGYRKPGNPAPVSGPGALSRRTDGGPTQGAKPIAANGQYGERKALQQMQTAAPMQGNPVPSMPTPSLPASPQPAMPPEPITNLFAPTERPEEPLTSGVPFGPGSNIPPALASAQDDVAAQIRAAYAMYPNEDLYRLVMALEAEGR
jgi:hypothetical protein